MANVLKTGTIVLAALGGLAVGSTLNWWRVAQFDPGSLPGMAKAREIVFDNGTVRAPDVFVRSSPAGIPIGGLRKCTHPNETLYTERDCPAGYREHKVNNRVTVLTPAPAAQGEPARRKSLYDVLDLRPDPTLREKMIERAAGG